MNFGLDPPYYTAPMTALEFDSSNWVFRELTVIEFTVISFESCDVDIRELSITTKFCKISSNL